MQIFKEISKKKLTIYVIIIVVMLSGSGYYLYKNYQLSKATTVADNYISPADRILANKQEGEPVQPPTTRTAAAPVSDITIGRIITRLDTSVFENSKFIALVDYYPKQSLTHKLGKDDIFEQE